MNKQEKQFSLDELVAEISAQLQEQNLSLPDRRAAPLPDARSIRYYTSLGLLDPPLIQNRRACYQAQHVEQALLVKALQSTGLSLQAIQKQIYGLSAPERQTLLQQLRSEPEPSRLLQAQHWQEYQLAPGLRLQVSASFTGQGLESCLQEIQKILIARGISP